MPLAFQSINRGTVAFGFFNIEIDMLLLQDLFFFADRFCEAAASLLADGAGTASLPGWRIEDPRDVGDLHGAIRGDRLTGFLGETYRRFPFPARPEDFKQSPEGFRNREAAEEMIRPFGKPQNIALARQGKSQIPNPESQKDLTAGAFDFFIGETVFGEEAFLRLVAYVERGGHPRWRDEIRPDYVREMTGRLKDAGIEDLGNS